MRGAKGDLIGDFVWEGSRHGGNGWQTGLTGSADGTMVISWGDVSPPMKKAVTADEWTPLIRRGKVPPDLVGDVGARAALPGAVDGGYHAAFGGRSNTRIYLAQQDRVIVSRDGETFATTAIKGLPVGANEGGARHWGHRGASDPVNEDVYYVFMGQHGLRYTLDGGATAMEPRWCPRPSGRPDPAHRFGLVEVDKDSAVVSGRKGRIAFSPCGEGVWLSTDGGVTGTRISTAGGDGQVDLVSCLTWIGGKLYVCGYDPTTNLPLPDNIRVYDPDAGTWSRIASREQFQDIVPDPRHPGGFWAFMMSNECLHSRNGTGSDFVYFVGYGNGEAPNKTHLFCRMKPRHRPLVAAKYRYHSILYAMSKPQVIGDYLYAPLGLGVARTLVADFPLAGASDHDPVSSAKWPLWEEDCAGIEEIVGMSALWMGNRLVCLGQDVPITVWEDGVRGHKATVKSFPGNALSDAHSGMRGSEPGYAVVRRTRRTQTPVGGFCYTLDGGRTWQDMPNQPQQGPAAIWESGCGVAGPAEVALCFPTRYGAQPQMTEDLGATPWKNLRFWIGDAEIDMAMPSGNVFNGFHGGDFSKNHHLACEDPGNPGTFYAVNIGGTLDEAKTSFVFDPRGIAGIYRMVPGDYPNFRRIYAGHPAHTANFGFYDTKLIADGRGHLVYISNYLPSDVLSADNKAVAYDIATGKLRPIEGVRNCESISFGAPFPGDADPCLWAIGWTFPRKHGLFFSRDLGRNWNGPFSLDVPGGGHVDYIDAHQTEWGVLGAAVKSRGHAIGRFRSGGD